MYAITGITGKVGGELAHNLLAAGQRVRAIVRNASKGEEWAARGCEVGLAKMEDGLALGVRPDRHRGRTFVDGSRVRRPLRG
jgi:NAD(P)H dehydrogenase (quinone)